jgi:hypothetical protein
MPPSSCHHMIRASEGFYGHPTTVRLMNGFGPPGGLGPLETLGMLLLASLIISLIIWGTREWKFAHEAAAPLFPSQQFLTNENTRSAYFQAEPPQPGVIGAHTRYEQPQAQYPELPAEQQPEEHYPGLFE